MSKNAVTAANPLGVRCPTCDASENEPCNSLAKRWQSERSRTAGVMGNGWRKTPHKERVLAARTGERT